jgi:hypothetical protein
MSCPTQTTSLLVINKILATAPQRSPCRVLRLHPITRPLNVRRDLLDDRPSRFSVFFYFSLLNFIACFAAALTAALAVAFSVCFVLNVRRRIALFDRIPDDDTSLFEFSI